MTRSLSLGRNEQSGRGSGRGSGGGFTAGGVGRACSGEEWGAAKRTTGRHGIDARVLAGRDGCWSDEGARVCSGTKHVDASSTRCTAGSLGVHLAPKTGMLNSERAEERDFEGMLKSASKECSSVAWV